MHYYVHIWVVFILFFCHYLDQLCDTTDSGPTTPSLNVKLHTPPVPPVLPDTASHEEVGLLFCV